MAGKLLPAARDGQQATIERSVTEPAKALLRLQLPTRFDPQTYADWTWVSCPITLPPTVPANAVIHLPTLRIVGGKVRADVAYTHALPKTRRSGHTVALGVDWGLNTLLSAGAARLHDVGTLTTLGSGPQFRAAGVLAKQHRLRRICEHLHIKTDHCARLADPALDAKAAVLVREMECASARRSNLNDALAAAAARWTVYQAVAAGASVIYLEDLRSMEERVATTAGRSRSLLSDADEVLLTVIYLRQVCPQKVLGDLLGMNPVTIGHAIKATRQLLDEQKITVSPTSCATSPGPRTCVTGSTTPPTPRPP